MKKLTILSILFVLSGCSSTFIYAPKIVCNHGDHNKTDIQGSDLKDNKAEQSSKTKLKLPVLP